MQASSILFQKRRAKKTGRVPEILLFVIGGDDRQAEEYDESRSGGLGWECQQRNGIDPMTWERTPVGKKNKMAGLWMHSWEGGTVSGVLHRKVRGT